MLSGLAMGQNENPFHEKTREINQKHSQRPVDPDNSMFRKGLWFRMDLRTKMNEPYFINNRELTKTIIELVREGKIKPYFNDSLTRVMPLEEFEKRLIKPGTRVQNPDMFDDEDLPALTGDPYKPRDIFILEFKEDIIFDRLHSKMVKDIQALSFIIDGSLSAKGVESNIGSFSYKELMSALKTDPRGIWFNQQNSAEHRTIEEAFNLRLMEAFLVKYENARDEYIEDMQRMGGKRSLIEAEMRLMQLIEYESNLWSK
jgi:gliding motility associated protien GldN